MKKLSENQEGAMFVQSERIRLFFGIIVVIYLFVTLVWFLVGVMTNHFQKAALAHLLFAAFLTGGWQTWNIRSHVIGKKAIEP